MLQASSSAVSNFTFQEADFSHALRARSFLPTHLQQLEISAAANLTGADSTPRVTSPFKSLALSFCLLKQFLCYKMGLIFVAECHLYGFVMHTETYKLGLGLQSSGCWGFFFPPREALLFMPCFYTAGNVDNVHGQ